MSDLSPLSVIDGGVTVDHAGGAADGRRSNRGCSQCEAAYQVGGS
jgi:hypothetical protein